MDPDDGKQDLAEPGKKRIYAKTSFWVIFTGLSFIAVGASSFLPKGSVLSTAVGILSSGFSALGIFVLLGLLYRALFFYRLHRILKRQGIEDEDELDQSAK